jgi:hypothetical protein
MSTYINNGLERTLDITIVTYVNSVETARTNYSGNNAFGSYPAITYNQLATMTDANFQTRLNAFIAYLEGINSGLYINPSISGSTGSNVAERTSNGMCTIGNSALLPENLVQASISGTTQVYATVSLAAFTSLSATIEYEDNNSAFLTTTVTIPTNGTISNKITPTLSSGATSILSANVILINPTYDADYIYIY